MQNKTAPRGIAGRPACIYYTAITLRPAQQEGATRNRIRPEGRGG